MAVSPTQSTQSSAAIEQYRQMQQTLQNQRQQMRPETTDRVTLQSTAAPAQPSAQQTNAVSSTEPVERRQAVAAYENASRAATQQPSAPEKQNEKTITRVQA
jgi:DNA polymerase III gamma/tau subunit